MIHATLRRSPGGTLPALPGRPGPQGLPVLLATLALLGAPGPALATPAAAPAAVWSGSAAQDSLALAELHARAIATDPRLEQADLQRRATELRMRNIDVSLRPQLELRGDASYQSEVVRFPLALGGGASAPEPPKERYEATLDAGWMLWDGGLADARRGVERARLTSELAGLESELHGVRTEVTDAFFAALLLQEQVAEIRLLLEDLEARLAEVRVRVREGVALPADTAFLTAEMLGAGQRRDALESELGVARDVLAQLTGTPLGPNDVLLLPDLSEAVARNRVPVGGAAIATGDETALPEDLRVHPQFAVFEAQRAAADRQAAVIASSRRPTVSAFGQLSAGSPGFRQFEDDPHGYWRAGVRFQWSPWNWGRTGRELEEVRVQQRLIETREDAFSERLLRAVQQPLRTMEHMRAALESDERIIALREQIERDARQRFAERVIPASAYTDARTDVQEARVARLRHRAELARAQALYLITLGVELR